MRQWEVVDCESVPGKDNGIIYLMRCGSEFVIHVDGRELMDNRFHGSEDALAESACERLEELHSARVLVGGLGMGFTLAAALRCVGPEGNVTVAELMPAVVRWNRELTGRAAQHPLRDPRSTVHIGDVAELIEGASELWSSVLLDVDNGPEELTRSSNSWLYTRPGLKAIRQALIPGGVLGIWSVGNNSTLSRRLWHSGYEVEVLHFTEYGRPTMDDSGTHILWMARRPAA